MRDVTITMINLYRIRQLGFDFMGYKYDVIGSLSFHHLVIPHRDCKKYGLGDGYIIENGAILVQQTSHDYLHTIERIDPEIFALVTSEMIDENIKGKLDVDNLRVIDKYLSYFEKEHCGERTKKGKVLIKEPYTRRIHF